MFMPFKHKHHIKESFKNETCIINKGHLGHNRNVDFVLFFTLIEIVSNKNKCTINNKLSPTFIFTVKCSNNKQIKQCLKLSYIELNYCSRCRIFCCSHLNTFSNPILLLLLDVFIIIIQAYVFHVLFSIVLINSGLVKCESLMMKICCIVKTCVVYFTLDVSL